MPTKSKPPTSPTRRDIICLCLAVKDAYLNTDQEDWCDKGFNRCGKCPGCTRAFYEWARESPHPVYFSSCFCDDFEIVWEKKNDLQYEGVKRKKKDN